jgi:hypothetical protein
MNNRKPKQGRPKGSLRGKNTEPLNLTLPKDIHDDIPEGDMSKNKWGRAVLIKAVEVLRVEEGKS